MSLNGSVDEMKGYKIYDYSSLILKSCRAIPKIVFNEG